MVLEIRAVGRKEAMKKNEVIKEISEVTGFKQYEIKEILRAFVDIHHRELIMTGAWDFPGMPYVNRHVKKATKGTLPDSDIEVEYPETCYLKAGIPSSIKHLHKTAYREKYNAEHGVTKDNWFEKSLSNED